MTTEEGLDDPLKQKLDRLEKFDKYFKRRKLIHLIGGVALTGILFDQLENGEIDGFESIRDTFVDQT